MIFKREKNLRIKITDPLPSWNDGAARQAITEFVDRVTRDCGPDFLPVPERIAVFDSDGTLWCERPVYVQLAFAIDRVKALADRGSAFGRLDKALDRAAQRGWIVVSMKNDWKTVFATRAGD